MIGEVRISNAVIESVSIEHERGLSAWITVKHDLGHQGFGGWGLGGSFCSIWIKEIFRVVFDDISSGKWEKLVGRPCRIKHIPYDKIIEIGNFIEDKWFNPESMKVQAEMECIAYLDRVKSEKFKSEK